MSKGMKRLDLWLPENHPIFQYPAGTRTKVAREWLDIGSRLSGVERKLEELEEKLTYGVISSPSSDRGEKKGGEEDSSLSFDPASFAKSILDVF